MGRERIIRSPKVYPGEWVEVRSQEEILATLDERGCLDNLPFMPEMLAYCGKRFLVDKRADKTCDTISGNYLSRRMQNAVHLVGVRCEGGAHGGCDATCLLFWKEAWLRRGRDDGMSSSAAGNTPQSPGESLESPPRKCTIDDLYRASNRVKSSPEVDGEFFYCQATELLLATSPLPWWDIRQYWREFASGNVGFFELAKVLAVAIFNWAPMRLRGVRLYPYLDTSLLVKADTPSELLDLQPGEIVRVKSIEDILRTLNRKGRNRGLYYDMNGELFKYCNKKVKVLKRVHKVIDERTGKLLVLKNESVILEGVICCGHFSPDRLLCPRSQYPFWREIWLERVPANIQTRMDS